MSITYQSQPTIDCYPWPDGLGFRGAEEWWSYVCRQTEADKLDLLITMAHLSDQICALLLVHDQDLFNRFQFLYCTLERLATIHVNSLAEFATALVEQDNTHLERCIE
jgi:hypothetical protein